MINKLQARVFRIFQQKQDITAFVGIVSGRALSHHRPTMPQRLSGRARGAFSVPR
jgi:hypothetical protein